MHSIRWSAFLGDLEFGDFLLRGITGGIRRNTRGGVAGVEEVFVGFGGLVVEGIDDLVRVDLG